MTAMRYVAKCAVYWAVLGVLSHIIGERLPRSWFVPDGYWFRARKWEKKGTVYEKRLHIRAWKDRLPDMSRLMPDMLPKRIDGRHVNADDVDALMRETCVAEAVHLVLFAMAFGCAAIWRSVGGWVVSVVTALCNIPFVLIQRYNRPKLQRLYDKLKRRELIEDGLGSETT